MQVIISIDGLWGSGGILYVVTKHIKSLLCMVALLGGRAWLEEVGY